MTFKEKFDPASMYLGISVPLFIYYASRSEPIGFVLTLILMGCAYGRIVNAEELKSVDSFGKTEQ